MHSFDMQVAAAVVRAAAAVSQETTGMISALLRTWRTVEGAAVVLAPEAVAVAIIAVLAAAAAVAAPTVEMTLTLALIQAGLN